MGWKFHRLIMVQWSNLTTCGLYFTSLPCGAHFPSELQRLVSRGLAALILILEKKSRLRPQLHIIIGPIYTASQPSDFLFMLGYRKQSDGAKSGKHGGWLISSKPQSCTAATATTYLCAGALSWWNRTPFVSFPGRLRNISNTTFQSHESPELLFQCGFIWKESMQSVSGKVEF